MNYGISFEDRTEACIDERTSKWHTPGDIQTNRYHKPIPLSKNEWLYQLCQNNLDMHSFNHKTNPQPLKMDNPLLRNLLISIPFNLSN